MTISEVRNELATLFEDETLSATTTKVYDFDLVRLVKAQIGTQYAAKMMHEAQINFVQYVLGLIKYKTPATQVNTEYELTISYIKEIDLNGDNFKSVTDYYETLYTRLYAVLGDNWNGKILGYNTQTRAPQIQLDFLHDKNVWISTIEISLIA